MTENGDECDAEGRQYRRRVVYVVKGRKREVEELTTGPSCKATCTGGTDPPRVLKEIGVIGQREAIDRPVVVVNGL